MGDESRHSEHSAPRKKVAQLGSRMLAHLEERAAIEARGLELEAKRIENEREDSQIALQHANRILEFQSKDLESQRSYEERRGKRTGWLVVFCVVAFLVFVWMCLAYDDKDLVVEVVKAAVYLLAGASAGYYKGYKKGEDELIAASSEASDDE